MHKRAAVAGPLAFSWIAGSAMFLVGISVLIVRQPNFPLSFGIVRTLGIEGLWATLLPAMAALAGLALVRARKTVAGVLVLLYSAYWAILLASGVPVVWNATSSFCLTGLGLCITVPWIGRAVVMGLLAAFALTGLWSWRMIRAGARPQ
jgi:hypothetical protein